MEELDIDLVQKYVKEADNMELDFTNKLHFYSHLYERPNISSILTGDYTQELMRDIDTNVYLNMKTADADHYFLFAKTLDEIGMLCFNLAVLNNWKNLNNCTKRTAKVYFLMVHKKDMIEDRTIVKRKINKIETTIKNIFFKKINESAFQRRKYAVISLFHYNECLDSDLPHEFL
jgi:hypothetical protein